MKNEKTNLFIFGALFLFVLATVSATTTFSVSTPATISQSQTTSSFVITNINSSQLLDVSIPSTITIYGENSYPVIFNIAGTKTGINSSVPSTITLTPSSSIDFSKFKLGKSYSSNIIITDVFNPTQTATIPFSITNSEFCSSGKKGDLEISDIEFNHISGFGEDDNEWYPGDIIEVSIDVENTGSEKIEEVTISWGLYNTNTGKWAIDNEEKSFDLKSDKEQTTTFKIELSPEDLDVDGDYKFYVKAYSDDEGESLQCDSTYESIDLMIDSDFVIATDAIVPESNNCGEEFEITADIWNIGEEDQEDVYAIIFNKELGLNKKIEIGDVDSLDNSKLQTSLNVPENATEKTYILEISIYDEDEEIFENDNDDVSRLTVPLVVKGECGPAKASVNAVLESGGKSGEDLLVRITLSNQGTRLTSYSLNAAAYAEWASSAVFDTQSVILNGGESKDVLATFKVKDDISGQKSFDIEVLSGNKVLIKQPISVEIKKSGFSLPSFGFEGDNWYLWVIGAINVILVIVIIVVAIKIAKK